jgi:hypothetical protein
VSSHALPVIDLGQVVRYAGASGDDNPIHYDPAAGGTDADGNLFAMGMLSAARVAALMADAADRPLRTYDVRFTDRVWLGQAVTVDLERDADRIVATAAGPDGPVISAEAETGSWQPTAVADDAEPVGPAYSWTVERGAVRDFLRATDPGGIELPDWRTVDAAPLTFLVTAQRWATSFELLAALGFDNRRMLHGASRFEQVGDLVVGSTYRVTDVVTHRREKEGRRGGTMRFADVVSTVTGEGGEVVARLSMRLIELPESTAEAPAPAPAQADEPITPFLAAGLQLVDPARGVLLGSRDPRSGEVFFPRRVLAVDGSLRELADVELATGGSLYAVTSLGGSWYAEVELDDGVHLHSRVQGDREPAIGDRVRLAVSDVGEWWFAHA